MVVGATSAPPSSSLFTAAAAEPGTVACSCLPAAALPASPAAAAAASPAAPAAAAAAAGDAGSAALPLAAPAGRRGWKKDWMDGFFSSLQHSGPCRKWGGSNQQWMPRPLTAASPEGLAAARAAPTPQKTQQTADGLAVLPRQALCNPACMQALCRLHTQAFRTLPFSLFPWQREPPACATNNTLDAPALRAVK